MLIYQLPKSQITLYEKYIQSIASLSGLFSESKIPFLHYRVAENIFCKSFGAENLSRSDISYDAKLKNTGIGLKTFIVSNNTTIEKIAEFNRHSSELKNLNNEQLIEKVSNLRNERIYFANRVYGIEKAIYHCLARQKNQINIFETNYEPIDINGIKNIRITKPSIFFEDDKNEYSFNFSKSTLYRKFYIPNNSFNIKINIIHEPYELILKFFEKYNFEQQKELENVILPLYSTRNRKNEKVVPAKSGLNQWNASGRQRNLGELYIPIPRKIHQFNSNFFPPRDKIFYITLPDGNKLFAKVCQEGGKALMTNPNKALSEWLLRKVLKLKLGEILTYQHLKILGIDSVKITKIDKENFKIDFAKIGSYEEFIN